LRVERLWQLQQKLRTTMQSSLSFIQNMPQTTNQLEHGGNSKKRKNVMKAQR
jgi:hypothetical protein